MIAKTVRGITDLAHLFSLGQDWGIIGGCIKDVYAEFGLDRVPPLPAQPNLIQQGEQERNKVKHQGSGEHVAVGAVEDAAVAGD